MPIYCSRCKSSQVEELVEGNRVYYFCHHCHQKSGKALVVDGRIKIINTSRGIKHIDTAAIIIKGNEMLFTDRRTYPFGLEIPVGHLEYNETIEEAIRREVYEEVGLKVTGATLVTQVEQPVSYCRYGSAIEEWAIFLVEFRGRGVISNNENQAIYWIDKDDIPVEKLTPHTRFALKTLGYINDTATAKKAAI